jgi:hypothetical protein
MTRETTLDRAAAAATADLYEIEARLEPADRDLLPAGARVHGAAG